MESMASILKRLVKRNFMELCNTRIMIYYEKDFTDGLMEYDRKDKRSYCIKVNRIMRDAPHAAVEGAIAHELAHIMKDVKMGSLTSKFDEYLYKLIRMYRQLDEKQTDLIVVMRGLGPKILALYRFRRKKRLPSHDDNGLTEKEVKKLVRRKSLPSKKNRNAKAR